jgi:hypothetical protein
MIEMKITNITILDTLKIIISKSILPHNYQEKAKKKKRKERVRKKMTKIRTESVRI